MRRSETQREWSLYSPRMLAISMVGEMEPTKSPRPGKRMRQHAPSSPAITLLTNTDDNVQGTDAQKDKKGCRRLLEAHP